MRRDARMCLTAHGCVAGILADRANRQLVAAVGAALYAAAFVVYALAPGIVVVGLGAAVGGAGGALFWVALRADVGARLEQDPVAYARLLSSEQAGSLAAFVIGLSLLGSIGYRPLFLVGAAAMVLLLGGRGTARPRTFTASLALFDTPLVVAASPRSTAARVARRVCHCRRRLHRGPHWCRSSSASSGCPTSWRRRPIPDPARRCRSSRPRPPPGRATQRHRRLLTCGRVAQDRSSARASVRSSRSIRSEAGSVCLEVP